MQGSSSSNPVPGAESQAVETQPVDPSIAQQTSAANRRGLVRNTLYLTVGQALTIPISIASGSILNRHLSSAEIGYMYVAGVQCGFASMAIEWGQQGSVPALIARDRKLAGVVLGTSLLWRLALVLPVALVMVVVSIALHFDTGLRLALALTFVTMVLTSCGTAYKDAVRGLERTDIPAYAQVTQQVLMLLITLPIVLLGKHMRELLLSYILVAALMIVYLHRSLRKVGISSLRFERAMLRPLLSIGTPFVFFGLAMVVLPNVNAFFLTELVPPEVIGAYSVSQRLIGFIIFPAAALIGALYPTLCRLHNEDHAEFVAVSRSALYGVSLLAIPAAVGCGMFPELGVMIFGGQKYNAAIDHLRVMSAFVFLVYFSMPLGTLILASNRQKLWALVQCICIVVAVIGNPLLVPWFQARTGNGALGTCVSLVVAELFIVGVGMALSPRAVFDRGLGKSVLLSALAGAVMAVVAYFTKPISLFLAVPAALLSYAAVAWFAGAVQPTTVEMLQGFVKRKLSRRR